MEYARRNREKVSAYQAAWHAANRERVLARNRELRQTAKAAAFAAYGGAKCACCGVTETVWLVLDHVNDDGSRCRKAGEPVGTRLYVWLRDRGYPPGFQVLCFNCNFAKAQQGGCPHRRQVAKTP
jgi:hypothetical protein